MAKLKLLSTIFSKLGTLSKGEGQIIVSKDSKSLYVDLNEERIEITDWIDIDTEESLLAILSPLTNKYYYTKNSNKIWRYVNGEWICLNNNINDQSPTYTESTSLVKLSSGEKLSIAFGKISKAITDLISHISDTIKHITADERTSWNNKYAKPSGGIPKSDLDSAVQTSLGKADTALQTHQDISGLATKTELNNHTSDKSNPHGVTKSQVGLGNCDNTSDEDKPISTAQQEEFDKIKSELINLWKTISGEDYTTNEAMRLSKVVKSHQNNNTFSFIAVSDMHNYGNNNETILTALEHCGQAMKLIRKMCNIDFCVSLGDYIWGGAGTESHDEAKSEHGQMAEILADPFGYNGLPQFRLVGNHDNNPQFLDTYLAQSELYNLIGSYSDGIKPSENAEIEKGYCYYDINKVRCFFLNTCDVNFSLTSDTSKWQNNMCSITAEQLQWFCDKIEEINAKTDASEWSFAIFSHHPVDWPNGGVYDANGDWQQLRIDYLMTVINAYIAGNAGSVAVMKNDSVTTTVTYDFGDHSAEFIADFHGHVHNYLSAVIGERFYRVAIPNACPERNNTYASSTSETYSIFGEPETYAKTTGTGEDTAFCVVTVDTVNKKIYADHYGAGYDREINYTQTAIPVTGVALSETSGSLHVGDTVVLTATISPADATNQSVTWETSNDSVATVTNGTVKVVGEGTATITATTADGGYTAAYTLTAARVNLLSTAIDSDGTVYNGIGYKDGYRINSSNAETVDSNTSLTGFIPVSKGDTLEFTNFGTGLGTTTSNPNYSYLRMTAYDSDFNVLATSVTASAILTQWVSNFSAHADITADSGGYMTKITFKATTLLANLAYIRLTVNGKISEMSNPGIYKS